MSALNVRPLSFSFIQTKSQRRSRQIRPQSFDHGTITLNSGARHGHLIRHHPIARRHRVRTEQNRTDQIIQQQNFVICSVQTSDPKILTVFTACSQS
jgi:hypothetical protein